MWSSCQGVPIRIPMMRGHRNNFLCSCAPSANRGRRYEVNHSLFLHKQCILLQYCTGGSIYQRSKLATTARLSFVSWISCVQAIEAWAPVTVMHVVRALEAVGNG